ncbi:helix-turn-helix domain-containing protein [Paraclostridium sordellii]|uniref:helix-turn-helix domain-containing protein n=1 Tax=Paraclostridium sordellii TaxID=1505 RepID=UPI001FCCCB65|nr:helix-turn-helix transcriptional regulator [Paeniclostridium sordellii]
MYEVIFLKERLRDLRTKHLKLTQQEFADSIKLSRSNVGNIESGIVQLTQRNIDAICEKFNVNEVWLKTGEGEVFLNLSPEEEFDMLVGRLYADDDSFKKNIIRAMLKLNDEDWLVVKKFTEELKKGM